MNKSLLKKYQPQIIDDINMDTTNKKLLELYLRNNRLYFLINGNSTVGKTSLVNVLLSLYYKKYQEEHSSSSSSSSSSLSLSSSSSSSLSLSSSSSSSLSSSLSSLKHIIDQNIIHINILKEQGINYYRNELKHFCQINNQHMIIKKTIIIDDIDHLNEQSQQLFNSLINNYENVNCIITCNNLNKIDNKFFQKLELIKIDNITHEFLRTIIDKIVDGEKMLITAANKEKIIKSANFCIPNMINILEKIKIMSSIDTLVTDGSLDSYIDDSICNILIKDMENYIALCCAKKFKEAIAVLDIMFINGYSVIDILDELTLFIKFHSKLEDEFKYKIIKIICKYINIFNNMHEDNIELLFLTNNIIDAFI